MTDREFLCWIHDLLERNGSDPLVDFMHRLRAIIARIPAGQTSNSCDGCNSLAELKAKLLRPANIG